MNINKMVFSAVFLFTGFIGCGGKKQETADGRESDSDTASDSDMNTDSDVDTGTDSDVDTDTGGDSDTDIDAGSDTDTDIGPDGGMDCDATFTVDASLSPTISTVVIVEWSSTLDSISKASIEFGLDKNYGYTAPVNLSEKNFRTLLLGMKASSTVHYRIVAKSDSAVCVSEDRTIKTGPLPTGINLTATITNPSAVSDGFIISSFLGRPPTAFILDKDGDLVWWYKFSNFEVEEGFTRAKMSGDGKFMWAGNGNVGGSLEENVGSLFKVGMDGLGEDAVLNISSHHDFTVLPDNSVAYIKYTEDDGDQIVEMNPSGETTVVYTVGDDFLGSGSSDWSHCNALHYIPADDAYTMSCLNLNNIIQVSRSGELLWAFEGDGDTGDFSGASWSFQHGHQLLDNGHLLIFNNGKGGFGGTSLILEFVLDENTHQANEVWTYDGDEWCSNYGDVQRISNGNSLISYSAGGEIREVTADKSVVRSIVGDALGYLDWRESLYGPPNRW